MVSSRFASTCTLAGFETRENNLYLVCFFCWKSQNCFAALFDGQGVRPPNFQRIRAHELFVIIQFPTSTISGCCACSGYMWSWKYYLRRRTGDHNRIHLLLPCYALLLCPLWPSGRWTSQQTEINLSPNTSPKGKITQNVATAALQEGRLSIHLRYVLLRTLGCSVCHS